MRPKATAHFRARRAPQRICVSCHFDEKQAAPARRIPTAERAIHMTRRKSCAYTDPGQDRRAAGPQLPLAYSDVDAAVTTSDRRLPAAPPGSGHRADAPARRGQPPTHRRRVDKHRPPHKHAGQRQAECTPAPVFHDGSLQNHRRHRGRHRRLGSIGTTIAGHGSLAMVTPVEYEQAHYAALNPSRSPYESGRDLGGASWLRVRSWRTRPRPGSSRMRGSA